MDDTVTLNKNLVSFNQSLEGAEKNWLQKPWITVWPSADRQTALTCIFHEGNEAQGKSGKQGWEIARKFIAIAMGEPEKGKDPVGLFPGERVAQGRASPDHPAGQECQAQMKGGSIKIAYRDRRW